MFMLSARRGARRLQPERYQAQRAGQSGRSFEQDGLQRASHSYAAVVRLGVS